MPIRRSSVQSHHDDERETGNEEKKEHSQHRTKRNDSISVEFHNSDFRARLGDTKKIARLNELH